MKSIATVLALAALAFAGGAAMKPERASAACHYYCKPGQALNRMKSYISGQCNKWNNAVAKTKCYRTSNGKPGDPTRIYYSNAHVFKGYGAYVYGYYGYPEKCTLVRIWEGLSKDDGHLWRIATETKGHSC